MNYFNYQQLKERGWSGTAIKMILQRPDHRVHIKGRRPVDLFDTERVQKEEKIHPYFNKPYRECRKTFRKECRIARTERKKNRVGIESVDPTGSSVEEQASSKSNAQPE